MQNRMQHLLASVLIVLLGSGSVVADASDWLPLAIGNSWTYSHLYHDDDDPDAYTRWTNYTHFAEFTLSVLRTEDIDGQTYFVVSDMPELWPPVLSQFIAGKKLRWEGDHLMERTADGEQVLFRFDGNSSEQVTTLEIHNYSSHDYVFTFSGGGGSARFYGAIDYYELDRGRELPDWLDFGATVVFLKGFGFRNCTIELGGEAPFFFNYLVAERAEINGRTVTVREARKEAAIQLKASDETSIEGDSWGGIKQEESE